MRAYAAASFVLVFSAKVRAFTSSLVLDGNDWQMCSGSTGSCFPNATVPGGVWDNLQRAGVVGDPRYRNNDVVFSNLTTAMWTPDGKSFASDIRTWTFAKNFDTPSAQSARSYTALELDGVQTNANVSLNGVPLLTTNNMFRQWRAELPAGLLVSEGSGMQNRLVIAVASSPSPATCSNPTAKGPSGHAPCTDVAVRAEGLEARR